MSWINSNYFKIKDKKGLRTPSLLLYPELVKENIKTIVQEASVDQLRPHVKTNKCKNLVQMMLDEGIYKFKCATLQEARMLAELDVKDIVIAYPIVGTQMDILLDLQKEFPKSAIKIIVDSQETIDCLNTISTVHDLKQEVYLDINLGMNRTGLAIDKLADFVGYAQSLSNVTIVGLHGYDGHIREEDIVEREAVVKIYFEQVLKELRIIESKYNATLKLIFGGSNTFPIYQKFPSIDCSPGTFILWDWGYHCTLPEQSYHTAAILVCRVVSKPNTNLLCLDLGYKAISSENPIDKRLHFLEKENWNIVSQSEEHLVVHVSHQEWSEAKIGEFVYIIPYHICPTVAMYPSYQVVEDGAIKEQWPILARY